MALEPRRFGALAGAGLIRMGRGEHRAALADYRRAFAINPFLQERHEPIPALERKVGLDIAGPPGMVADRVDG